MSYQTQHQHFTMPDGVVIPEGFEDTSWINDAMPSFYNKALNASLWIDYPKEESEMNADNDWMQFNVDTSSMTKTGDYNDTAKVHPFKTWEEANTFIESLPAIKRR